MIELSNELEIEDKPDLDKIYEFVATITYSIYYNQQTNYGIYEFTTDEKLPYTNSYMYKDKAKYLGCLNGNMQELYCETDYKISAKLKYNAKYKKYDYQVQSIFSEQPKTLNEQRKFLEVLCTKRQTDILLNSYPNIVEDIMTGKYIDTSNFKGKGIGDKTFNKIKEKILENYVIQDILVLLRPLGVTFNTIKKMLGIEDNPSLLKQKIIENPYILTSVHGLGFKKVDELALKLTPELRASLQRTKAFLFYTFKEIASREGHTWISKRDLIGYVRKDLRECIDIYKDFIEQEVENPTLLYIYDEKIGLLKYYNTAKNIVEHLFWLNSLESMIEPFTEKEMDDSIQRTEKELGFELTAEQKNAIKSINKHNVVIVTAPAGAGKEQPLTSKILTPNGWTKMGDIKLMDKVVGDDGNSYTVTGIYPQGEKDVYEIIFSDDSKVECGLEHLWDIKLYGDRIENNKYITYSLKNILKDGLYDIEKSGYKRWKYYIPMTKPVIFNKNSNLSIEPYAFGLLIGDGCFVNNKIKFTNPEEDLLTYLKEYVESVGMIADIQRDRRSKSCSELTINKMIAYKDKCYFTEQLRHLNLLGKHSYDKFIPKEYLYSTIQERIDLLSGLIDTDGEVDKSGYVYSTTSYQLALDVQFLVQSLGGTAKIEHRQTYFTYKGEKKAGLPSYRLNIKMPRNIQIFKSIKHKNKFFKGQTKARRTIREIKYIGKKQCQCIMVNSPNYRYLTDDCVVTHNTTAVKGIFDLLSKAKIKKKFLNSEYNQIHSEDQITEDELFTYGDFIQGSFDDISVTDDYNVIKIGQSALSAKAAKRMKEVSGQDAMTMHRMLGYSGKGFAYKKDFPMKYHVNVLDEASMINKSLINSYINAIRPHGKFIIIFDFAQLPPIGSGDFARDVLKSKLCINKFTKVHRQGEKSGILMDANKIRVGINPIEKLEKKIVHGELRDMFYRFETDKEKMRDMAVEAYLKSVKDVGLEEAVIITPRKRKCINSANELNKIIQDKVIPNDVPSLTRWKDGEKCIFKLGAKVMQKKNNYKKDKMVFNGDEGYITDINKNGFSITFGLENGKREVRYTNSELDQIELSYCMSVHACLTKDTLLLTDSGILELKNLDDNTQEKEIKKYISNIKVYNGNELEIPSQFINNGLSECKKITTKRGYTITATLDHGLDVLCDNGYIMRKNVKDITNNDILVLKAGTNIYGNNLTIPLEWSKYSLDIRSERFIKPNILTKDFAKFLGYMVADGTVAKKCIKLTKRYIEVVEDYRNIVSEIFGYYYDNIRYRYGDDSNYEGSDYIYEVCSSDIANFCKNIDGIQPHDKYVPSIIMQAPKEFQIEFIKSFFEDGTILLKKGKYDFFEICIKNKKLTYQMQAILLNIGVVSSVSYKSNTDCYRLYIYKNDMKVLYNNGFRFISDFKNKRLEIINQKCRRSDRKSIPYITKIIGKLINKYNITKINQNIYLSVREGQITHFMLDRFLEQTKNILKNDTDYIYLKQFCQGVFIDTVKEINNTYENTYCLTMPETHKFLQNGFMGWNCQGSQYHSVICIFDMSSYIMLNRKILYTAITRARKKCMLISEPRAFKACLDDENNRPRNTFLSEMFETYNIEDVEEEEL
jgi:hypothetical protein